MLCQSKRVKSLKEGYSYLFSLFTKGVRYLAWIYPPETEINPTLGMSVFIVGLG